MDQYSIKSAIDVSVIEVVLISVIAFIGAFVHEYIAFIQRGKRITLMVWYNIFITVIVDVIISVSINPFIMLISPRLILLPPLLIGLLGTELATKLSTIHGSTSVIEYLLNKIFKPKSETSELPTDNDPIDINDSIMDAEIDGIRPQIETLIKEYDKDKDRVKFIEGYGIVKNKTTKIRDAFESIKTPSSYTIANISKMIKLETALDRIYENILIHHGDYEDEYNRNNNGE